MKQRCKTLDVCVKFKITLLLRGEVPQRSAFVAKKVQQLLTRRARRPRIGRLAFDQLDLSPRALRFRSEDERSKKPRIRELFSCEFLRLSSAVPAIGDG
jgi:hypothetical protein